MKQINFKRRDAPDAHPMAQEIAKPMHEEFFKLTRASQLSKGCYN